MWFTSPGQKARRPSSHVLGSNQILCPHVQNVVTRKALAVGSSRRASIASVEPARRFIPFITSCMVHRNWAFSWKILELAAPFPVPNPHKKLFKLLMSFSRAKTLVSTILLEITANISQLTVRRVDVPVSRRHFMRLFWRSTESRRTTHEVGKVVLFPLAIVFNLRVLAFWQIANPKSWDAIHVKSSGMRILVHISSRSTMQYGRGVHANAIV